VNAVESTAIAAVARNHRKFPLRRRAGRRTVDASIRRLADA
jgi:hypothetical protein